MDEERPRRAIKRKPAEAARQLRVLRTGLHDEAAMRLRALIVRGELPPGEALNEVSLSEALGVSRTPLREALKLLAAEGLVELRRNRSPIVAPLRRDEVLALFEAVAGIERIAAELAALRMSARDLKNLRALHDRMEDHHERGRLRDYFSVNQQIHDAIVVGARNAPLRSSHDTLMGQVERARYLALSAPARWDESVAEHWQILQALEARDSDRAGRLLRDHVLRTGQIVSTGVNPQDSEGLSPAAAAMTHDG